MKAHYFRIPVSSWKDGQSIPVVGLFPTATERGSDAPAVIPSSKAEDYYLVPDGKPLAASHRLVVIVPPGEFEEQELARKLSRMGSKSPRSVLLLGLASDPVRDSLLRRRMATLCSILRAPYLNTDYRLIFRESWLNALPEILQDSDRVVCFEEHYVTGWLFRNQRLAQQLVTSLNIPVYVVQGIRLKTEEQLQWSGLKELLVWACVLLTMALFILVQVRIEQTIPGMMGTIAEIFTVGIEVLLIIRITSLGD